MVPKIRNLSFKISLFDIVGRHKKNATNVYFDKWIKPILKIYMSSYPQEGEKKVPVGNGLYADTADTACECGTSEQTMQHLLRCPLLENECSLEDLATANEKALHCARACPNIWFSSEMMDTKEDYGKLIFYVPFRFFIGHMY